jgi:hypothetical protein
MENLLRCEVHLEPTISERSAADAMREQKAWIAQALYPGYEPMPFRQGAEVV